MKKLAKEAGLTICAIFGVMLWILLVILMSPFLLFNAINADILCLMR